MSKINCILRTFLLLFAVSFLLACALSAAPPRPMPKRCSSALTPTATDGPPT